MNRTLSSVLQASLVAVLLLGATAVWASLDEARIAQSHTDELSNELMQKMIALEAETNRRKAPLFIERNKMLEQVEGFWARTIQNHPSHGNWIFGQDNEILPYIKDISVEDVNPDHHHYKIVLKLRGNPFIADTTLWRKITGLGDDTASEIHWVADRKPSGLSFFNFFDAKSERPFDPQTISDISHTLRYEIYQNPFTFYDLPTIDELAAQQQHYGADFDNDGGNADVSPEDEGF